MLKQRFFATFQILLGRNWEADELELGHLDVCPGEKQKNTDVPRTVVFLFVPLRGVRVQDFPVAKYAIEPKQIRVRVRCPIVLLFVNHSNIV
ncbi:hypothetical protein [Paraburkholderia caribensis]|uniref:hypothetical protein n=1 Tax=Paraburkholderia caribensis TaxID=75105 RepID=UPI0012E8C6B1|nr:hypothetical protein [Paraburkholderia caribensis]